MAQLPHRARQVAGIGANQEPLVAEPGQADPTQAVGARYKNRSLLVIANEPFSAWGKIFGGDAMTLAAVDRSHIFELNVESYRHRAAIAARQAEAGESADETQAGGQESG